MSRSLIAITLSIVAFVLGSPASSQELVRVPQDVADLQDALDDVRRNGGIVEIAAGVYPASSRPFRLRHTGEVVTVRAAAGAEVILTGNGVNSIFQIDNDDRSRGQRVFFEGLTFRDGFSDEDLVGGAVSLLSAEASFIDCVFENNSSNAPSTGGGGVMAMLDTDAVFIDTTWQGNSAKNRGGGLAATASRVEIQRGTFRENRVNLPGHASNAVGGGVYLVDAKARIVDTHFESNQAAFAGGGLFAFGTFVESIDNPVADVQIFDSRFVDNLVQPDDCCVIEGPTFGGGVHVEDQATVRIYRSEFIGNRAEFGGGLDNFRGIVEIFDSVFENNLSVADRSETVAGGAIFVSSNDSDDSSTEFGAINRRPAVLKLEGSLLRGDVEGAPQSQAGACLFAAGDTRRLFGDSVLPQEGTVESNRAVVTIAQTTFSDCHVQSGGQPGNGFGGALNLRLVDLTLEDSLVLGSSCLTEGCGGGGLAAFGESLVRVQGSTFAGNGADRGGAIFASGSTLDIDGSFFLNNRISEDDAGSNIINSRGAGIFSIPGFNAIADRERNAFGEVRNSVFAGNIGVPVFEADTNDGPVNEMVYNGNSFFSDFFNGKIFVNLVARAGGETVPELNALTVQRGNGSSTDKSSVANTRATTAPAVGQVLATPRQLFSPAGQPARTFLSFGWSGNAAVLDGVGLNDRSGILETGDNGDASLQVNGGEVDLVSVGEESCSIGPLLCLRNDRFTVGVDWERVDGITGPGQGVQLTPDTGYFFFFNPNNVEMVVKTLFGCPQTNHFWVFAGGLTNVQTEIRVVDSQTGHVSDYLNPLRTSFQPVQDTAAFPTCDAPAAANAELELVPVESPLLSNITSPTLVLDDGRFEVDVTFRTANGQEGQGQAVQLTRDTGYFFFFNEANVEMVVKILRGCGVNDHYWVFAGGLTNVEVEMTVTDTLAGQSRVFMNPQQTAFQPIQDIMAFPTCP